MLKNAIVLTGGIGTGKSTVASFLKMYGYKIIDADEISKKVFEEKKEEIKKQELEKSFGKEVVNKVLGELGNSIKVKIV